MARDCQEFKFRISFLVGLNSKMTIFDEISDKAFLHWNYFKTVIAAFTRGQNIFKKEKVIQ